MYTFVYEEQSMQKRKKCIHGVLYFCQAAVEDRCYSYLLHIMSGYQCDKVVTNNDTIEVK